MRTVLITGANRGIGLLLSRLYGEHSDSVVYATCRRPDGADELRALSRQTGGTVRIIQLDVTDKRSIAACAEQVRSDVASIDVLINNAGILPGGVAARDPSSSAFGSLSAEAMLEVFRTKRLHRSSCHRLSLLCFERETSRGSSTSPPMQARSRELRQGAATRIRRARPRSTS